VVSGDTARYGKLFAQIKPQVPAEWVFVEQWNRLPDMLRDELLPDDLVVAILARRGSVSWHRELERVPQFLASSGSESFLMVYPSEAEPGARRDFSATTLPRALDPKRVVFDLPPVSFDQALDTLLRTEFADDMQRLQRIGSALVRSEREFSTEILPGVVVPHARVDGLAEPMLFLGISPEGIEFPTAKHPARLIFLLLSPAERPNDHLRDLADVARLVSRQERVEDLLNSRTVDDLLGAFAADGRPAKAEDPATI